MPAARAPVAILVLLALAAATASGRPLESANSSLDRGSTVMYEDGKKTGSVNPGEFANPLWLSVDCSGGSDYNGGSVAINARRTWVYVNDMADRHWGLARRVRPGRWEIYFVGQGRTLVGFARQRTSRRWDVYDHRSHRVGYTLGPDGPQAAAVALTMC